MSNFKIHQRVRVKSNAKEIYDNFYNNEGKEKSIGEVGIAGDMVDSELKVHFLEPINRYWLFRIDQLEPAEASTEEKPAQKHTDFDLSKLMHGEKYKLDNSFFIYTFVADLKKYGCKNYYTGCSLIFIRNDGVMAYYNPDSLKNIKPHVELINKSITGWIAFAHQKPVATGFLLSEILGFYADNNLYQDRNSAFLSANASQYCKVEISIKELPDNG